MRMNRGARFAIEVFVFSFCITWSLKSLKVPNGFHRIQVKFEGYKNAFLKKIGCENGNNYVEYLRKNKSMIVRGSRYGSDRASGGQAGVDFGGFELSSSFSLPR
jgi:hypothetical protein